jgi:hypothetical protein
MAAHNWLYVLEDLHANVIGDVTNASGKQLYLPLNRLPTAAFQIPINHYLAPYVTDPNWDGLLKVYRDGVLRFHGPVVSTNEALDGNNQTVAVNAAGPLWRLQYRFLGNTSTGWSLGNAGTNYDLGYIAQQMLLYGNSVGFTGISGGTNTPSSNGSAGVYYFKDVLSALGELSTGLNSFDFEVVPTEATNVAQPWPQIGVFNTTNLIGSVKSNAIFEYGTTNGNVASYSRQIDRTQMATKGYIEQPAATDHSGTLTAEDTTVESTRGVFEALIDNGGTEWDILRQALVNYAISIRKNPRQVVNFQPVVNSSPTAFTDFIVGDQVRCRINVLGKNVLDSMMRIWGITFDLDQQDNEKMTLELIHP